MGEKRSAGSGESKQQQRRSRAAVTQRHLAPSLRLMKDKDVTT